WEVMVGDGDFYAGARQLELALAGLGAGESALRALGGAAQANAAVLPLEADLVMTNDLAALPLARHRPGRGHWAGRSRGALSRGPAGSRPGHGPRSGRPPPGPAPAGSGALGLALPGGPLPGAPAHVVRGPRRRAALRRRGLLPPEVRPPGERALPDRQSLDRSA